MRRKKRGHSSGRADRAPRRGTFNRSLQDQVQAIAQRVVAEEGLLLDYLEFPSNTIRCFITKDGGVTLDDCQTVSGRLGMALDLEDCIPFSYVLEVSSPGLDRPLRSREDYRRFVGQTIQVTLRHHLDGRQKYHGVLAGLEEERIHLHLPSDQREVAIPFEEIAAGRLAIDL